MHLKKMTKTFSLLNNLIDNVFEFLIDLFFPKANTSILFFFEKYSTNFFDLITSPENLPENGSRAAKNKIFFTFLSNFSFFYSPS